MIEEKDYVSPEVAQLLYEIIPFDTKTNIVLKDFNIAYKNLKKGNITIYCKDGYTIPCPLLYEVQNWLREKYNLFINPSLSCANNEDSRYYWIYNIIDIQNNSTINDSYIKMIESYFEEEEFSSYQEALNEGIKEAIEHYVDTIK